MKIQGNLRKMRSELQDPVQYQLPIYNGIDFVENIGMNDLIGQSIRFTYEGYWNSILSGERMPKPYGEGLTYPEFQNSPEASPSILRPELSQIHHGIALRDYDWEMEHHMKPHAVYLSITSGEKVGVTRLTQIPTRWIDQGAVKAVVIAETPYRQLAGLIEVALKEHVSDKTNWQRMLKGESSDVNLLEEKARLVEFLSEKLKKYIVGDREIVEIHYPVEEYPLKVKSIKLDKVLDFEAKLTGIRGQYLIFEDNHVMNVRSHSGCRVSINL